MQLALGLAYQGKNGSELLVSGETKEDAVADLRAFIRGPAKAASLDLALMIKGEEGFTFVTLKACPVKTWVVYWKVHPRDKKYVGFDKKTESWDYPVMAVNEFCSLAYRNGLWE